MAARSAILAALVLTYWVSFSAVYRLIGGPTFLLGLGICLVAGAWLGVRGALVLIACIALVDRWQALNLPVTAETNRTMGAVALLLKLVLAGGLGLVVDSRRKTLALNAELRREVEAREHSERMQRALVESLGEGVGLFDARGRVMFANQALATTLGASPAELEAKTFADWLTDESRGVLATTTRPAASAARMKWCWSAAPARCCS